MRTADRSQNLMNAGDEWLALRSCNGGVVLYFVAVFVSRACAFNRAAAVKATAARRGQPRSHVHAAALVSRDPEKEGRLVLRSLVPWAVVDCSIFAISRHGPGTLRPFARALRNRGAPTRPFSRDRNQRHALRFFFFSGRKGLAPALEHAAAIPLLGYLLFLL